jgi:hypothetical protein
MRAKDDAQFAEAQRAMRRLDGAAPITKELLAPIKKLSKDDGEEWRFAPIACLSHCERDNFNYLQIVAFAKAFNLPLIRWRLQLAPSCAHLLSEDEMGSALEEEPAAYGYFCEGVPILFAHSIRSTRKLVNGTPGLLDSLVYKNGMPDGVRQAFARGGFSVTDSEAPYAVNARVSGGLWHGVELDDLSSLVESVASDATVVSLLLHSKETLEITLYSIKSAQFGLPAKLDVHDHGFILAFALTDFKLQGRTLPRLLISLGPRPSPPYVDINSFYVIVSRVCGYDGLRWLDCDPHEMEKLFSLRWKVQLAAWEQGFDEHGAWCPRRACSWLETQKEVIAASREEAAKAKEAARPLDQLRHPKLKERCVALGLDAAGTRAMLIERLKRAQSVDSIPAAQKAQMRPPAPKVPAPPKPAPSRPQAAALRTAPARPAPPGPLTAQTAQQLAEPFIAHALARFAVLRESLTTNSSALVEVAGDPAKRQHFLGVGLARAQWTDRWPANGNAAREHFVAAVQRELDSLEVRFPGRVFYSAKLCREDASPTHFLIWAANHGNWHGQAGVAIHGGGMANDMKSHWPGVLFGIITTPVAGIPALVRAPAQMLPVNHELPAPHAHSSQCISLLSSPPPSPLSKSPGRSPRLPVASPIVREAAPLRRAALQASFESESESLEAVGVLDRRFFPERARQHLSDRAYAECPQLQAMAVHFGVDIVALEGRRFYDGCNVYAADAARMTERSVSWRETLVPRLQRQQAGQRLPTERPLIVIVWNGVNHFDAAVPAIGRHGRGARKRVRDAAEEADLPAHHRARRGAAGVESEQPPSSPGFELVGANDNDPAWRPNLWPSVTAMLDAAGLELLKVPGDGACAYWSVLSSIDDGLPRAFFADGRQPLLERQQADRDACTWMRSLRAAVVAWLVAPEQRRMLCSEPKLTLTFEEYAAERFTLCRKCVRNVLRAQAGIPIPLPKTRDVVQPFEARKMLDVCGLLR